MTHTVLRGQWTKPVYTLLIGTLVLISMLALAGCGGGQVAGSPAASPTAPTYQPPTAGTPIDPPRQLADFTLTNQDGKEMKLSDLRGKFILLYFGYTYCPDICPTTLADLVRVKHDLGEQASQVAFVMVSVDGERDNPEVLKQYLANFDPNFIGLMGDARTLRKLGPDYGLYFEKREVEGTSAAYFVDHSAATYLIDKEGRLRMIYGYGIPADVMSTDVRTMLEQESAS